MIPTAIIFDLDDTLYLEVDYVRSGFRAVAIWASENLNVDSQVVEAEFNSLFDSGSKTDTFNRWLEKRGLDTSILAPMLDVYRNHSPQIAALPDVIENLPGLAACYSLGLVSDGRAKTQQLKWQALGLATWFQGVVFSDSLGREHWKPHPLPFLTAAKQMGIEPNSCVYVGDNPTKDFVGARVAGMASIRVRRRHGLHYDAITSIDDQADTEISDLNELTHALAQIANHTH